MSFHELMLEHRYYGLHFFTVLGFFVTTGIWLSCVCRINASRPRLMHISLEQMKYLLYAAWAMEAFSDLLFLRMFSGYDVAIGIGVLLDLSSSYKHWQGDDCICDALNFWRLERAERLAEIRKGHNYGRRSSDRH